MAATLSELQAWRAALVKAIASATLTVRHGESSVTYRSMKEMMDALAFIDGQIAALSDDGATRVKIVRVNTGYGC